MATGYGAGLAQAPFLTDQAKAADQVNAAIAAAPAGTSPQLVSPDMLSDVGWVLTSALYMNAKWATPFDPDKTTKDDFTLADGKTVLRSYLEGNGFSYARSGGWTAVDLPYEGGKLTMTALLPPAGSAPVLRAADPGGAGVDHRARCAPAAPGPAGHRGAAQTAAVVLPKVSLRNGPAPAT